MRKNKLIASLLLGILIVTTGAPVTITASGLALSTTYAAAGVCESSFLAPATKYTPATWPQIFAAGQPGNGADYACGYGSSISYFNADGSAFGKASTIGNETGTVIQTDASGKTTVQKAPSDCNAGISNLSAYFNPTCWGRMLGALIASGLTWIGSMFLWITGSLFNYLVQETIINFRDFIYGGQGLIGTAIDQGWAFFRDIANIAIIGIFTFIALSIIMGLQTYGQKKLIAKVLIVAILLNFSLLFTKMAIDVSSFLATQFYNAAIASPARTTDSGISGELMRASGITGFGDAYKQVRQIQEQKDNGFIGIGFGIMSFIYFTAAAAVFLYGAILLIARAAILIILMITSALAFATYLIPSIENSAYGWKTWSETLGKTAVFAPLLMLFLWITLEVARGMGPLIGTSTIGAAETSPAPSVTAIFGYLMVLAMLFLSLKLSSRFASSMASGFALAAVTAPFALGAKAAGLGYQFTAGKRFQNRSDGLDSSIAKAHVHVGSIPTDKKNAAKREAAQKHLESLVKQKAALDRKASRSGNLANTTIGKYLAKQAGLTGPLAGAEAAEGGYHGRMERKAKQTADTVSALYSKNRGDFEKAAREKAANDELEKREESKKAKDALDAYNAEVTKLQTADAQRKAVLNAASGAATAAGDSWNAHGTPAQALKNAEEKEAAAKLARDAATAASATATTEEERRVAATARIEATNAEAAAATAKQEALAATSKNAALASDSLTSQKALETTLKAAMDALPSNTPDAIKEQFKKALEAQGESVASATEANDKSQAADTARKELARTQSALEDADRGLAKAKTQDEIDDAKLLREQAVKAVEEATKAFAPAVAAAEEAHVAAEPKAKEALVLSEEAVKSLGASLTSSIAALHTATNAPGEAPVVPPVAASSGAGRGGGKVLGQIVAEDTKINDIRDRFKNLSQDLEGFSDTVKHVTERYKEATREYEEYRVDHSDEREQARAVERSLKRVNTAARKLGDQMNESYQKSAVEAAARKATSPIVKIFGGNSTIVARHAAHMVEDAQKNAGERRLKKWLTDTLSGGGTPPSAIVAQAEAPDTTNPTV